MVKVNIDLGERSYPIYITSGYDNLGKCIHSAKIQGKIVIITDSNVDVHQAGSCCEALLKEGYEPYKYVIEAGEKSKNLDTVRDIYKFLIGLKLDRQSTIIALGGGVTGDISGFVAATFLRGINFVQIPTTLLAQADSSVGGKVGVDLDGSKNIIGAFYQPKFVYMNVDSLRTLPERDLKSGLAEIIKHGVIKDADFLDYIDYNAKKIFSFDRDVLQYLAKVNCGIKGSVVEQDEKESGLREILNFGHTIGHAIETVSGFDLLHGECVALGMVAACKMAVYMELAEEEVLKKVVGVLKKTGLPVSLPGIDVDRVYNQMFHDKKVKNGKLTFVLPRNIGEVVQLGIDDEALIKRVIRELQ